jgi:hypothetical protein
MWDEKFKSPTVTRTKHVVELSRELNVGGLNVKHQEKGALMFRPPMFSPSDNWTQMVGPSDNLSAVRLVLVKNSLKSKSKRG